MAKKIIRVTETQLRNILKDSIMEEGFLRKPLVEGIDIKKVGETNYVSLNFSHQKGVDTNDLIHPYIIENSLNDRMIMSVFQRKDNDENNKDGNPLVYALKGINNWEFADPDDAGRVFNIFVAVTKRLQKDFDTLIMTPSNNAFNNKVFNLLKECVSYKKSFTTLFHKLNSDKVYNSITRETILKYANGDEFEAYEIGEKLKKYFEDMHNNNGCVFSYKLIYDVSLRQLVQASMEMEDGAEGNSEYQKAINNKVVLVFDDTVTTGRTLSESAELITQNFSPKSITFLTVFSPRTGHGFENNIRYL